MLAGFSFRALENVMGGNEAQNNISKFKNESFEISDA